MKECRGMRRLTFVAGLVLATSAGFAQRLVTVNFAATDADGKAVTDLTAAEIQITDQGKTAAIAAFRNESLRSPAAAREISNRPAPALTRVQVILFDLLNLSLANRKPAIDQIVRALEKAGTSESVYIYLLNVEGDLAPVRPLPVTQAEATAAAATWTREAAAMLDKAIGPVTVRPQLARDVVLRVQKTYEALAMLAGRMAGMPGRKNILWITFGVPCTLDVEGGQRWDCRSILGQVTDKLDLANVAVSPIAMQSAAADVESNNTLQQLVDSTGGKLYAGGDIERAIPDAIEVSRSSYRLQYAPPGAGWDGKAHKLRLSSTRKGVTVTAKQNYMATKTAAPVNVRDRNLTLFQTAFDGAVVGLNVTVT
ncbi:MAG: hypothetical protein JWP63_4011, partial [Candidatus Solibacter sp.]|nr:hypothetical protein [Candidatus Solibacter sp.]